MLTSTWARAILPSYLILANLNFADYMQMLDDFVDVTKDEKLIMHMWNSFVRKQRSGYP
jgi:hypothetical protein